MEKDDIYIFNNIELEQTALLHPSKYKNEEFQRLEFLGDRLISKVLAMWVLKNTLYSAKKMSIWINNVICANTMSTIGQFLVKHITYTGSMEKNIICDTLESWLGAIAIDGGNYDSIVLKLWEPYLCKKYVMSSKNQLQEYCHNKKINYSMEYIKVENNYICIITALKFTVKGRGISKKLASINASTMMLKKLQNTNI